MHITGMIVKGLVSYKIVHNIILHYSIFPNHNVILSLLVHTNNYLLKSYKKIILHYF